MRSIKCQLGRYFANGIAWPNSGSVCHWPSSNRVSTGNRLSEPIEPRSAFDAVIVGGGPNGLAAAITLARAGKSVVVFESSDRLGGGTRTAELTLPGFRHDVCSAIHPLAILSPFFREVPLHKFGLEWIHPEIPLVHPIVNDLAATVHHSLDETAEGLGQDAATYRRLLTVFCQNADKLLTDVLAPVHFPQYPQLLFRFGLRGIRSAEGLAASLFENASTRGMFAGLAAHSVRTLDRWLTAAVGLMFCVTAHSGGWPFPRGGSESLSKSMQKYLESLGGCVRTNTTVRTIDQLSKTKAILFDTSPSQLIEIAGDRLPQWYGRRLFRFRHGPGAFKVDWALDEPIPWKANTARRAGTVHVGGTFEEIASAERSVWNGQIAETPFVLVAQQSLFDSSRAPSGNHTAWAYCHVPAGSSEDMTERIESQIERFAPGFRDCVLARHRITPSDLENYNANYIRGDITGGVMDLRQTLVRPASLFHPYCTPNKRIFICSASTPPGPGVHGMCGFHAARAALNSVLR